MLRVLAFVLGFLGACSPLAAAPAWVMRPAESAIAITATQQGGEFKAAFTRFTADIEFDPADLASSAVVATIDMASFDSKNGDRDAQVKEPDWFDVASYPSATFATKSFKDLGGGRYEAVADLTIRGVTREVVMPFTLEIAGAVARMSGSVPLVRTDFGVGQGQWSSGGWVGLDVKVDVAIVADRAG